MVEQAGRIGGAVAVADAVEARQIRRRLGGGDDVIDADGVLRVGQRDLDDFRAERFVMAHRRAHRRVHLRVDAVDEILARHAEPHALQIAPEERGVVGHRFVEAGGILRVAAGDGVEHERGVAYGFGERADLIE